ncbi:MAG: alpha/beta hydrolase [Desulfobacterales bacterium]|nr:MAG: alpha/beta hydrolase [Desulfobacterales bacterium]
MERRETQGLGFVTGKWPLDPDQPTIVFIHGAGGAYGIWESQVESLSELVNTVALNLPGHGNSGGTGKRTITEYAQAVIEFIDAIGAPAPIPCGISMGGAITQQLLVDYPQRFPAGILISTGAKLKVMPAIFETIENDYSGFVAMIVKAAASAQTDPERLKSFREEIAGCRPEITFGDFEACHRFDETQRLSQIKVPVLIITAEDDKLTPPKYGDFLAKEIKNASRAHLKQAGHIVPLEKPDEVSQAIREFLERWRSHFRKRA